MNSGKHLRLSWIAALMALVIAYRFFIAGNLEFSNSAPLMAMAFGGGLLLGRKFWWVPAAALILSDIALGMGSYTLFSAVFYTIAALAGAHFAKNGLPAWPKMWLGTLTFSVIFYVAANTFSWALAPQYAKTVAGWWQSQTLGIPDYAPSYTFLRNALIGDTIWCVIAAPLFFWKPVIAERAPVSVEA